MVPTYCEVCKVEPVRTAILTRPCSFRAAKSYSGDHLARMMLYGEPAESGQA